MKTRFHQLLSAGAWLLACTMATTAAVGQSATKLAAPDEVSLYIHAELKNTDFVEPIVCLLRRVLVAPVETHTLNLSLGREMLASPTQFDVVKIGNKFGQAIAALSNSRTFNYFFIPYDMKDQQFRFVFATGFGNASTAYHLGVVSMARLESRDPELSRRQRAEVSALRAYKLVIKSIARVAGFPDFQRCVLAFPRNLDELDHKSAEFCPPDRAALVEAGILKAEESAGCVYVSERRKSEDFVMADYRRIRE
jgi:predicted Zn-dependent protease